MKNNQVKIYLIVIINIIILACSNQNNNSSIYITSDAFINNNEYIQSNELDILVESNKIINNDEKIINLYNNEPIYRNGLTIDQYKMQHPYLFYRTPKRIFSDYIEELYDDTSIKIQTYEFNYTNAKNSLIDIFAGTALDIIWVESSMIMFFIKNNLIIPLNLLYSEIFTNDDNISYVSKMYVNNYLYGLNIHTIPDHMFFYSKKLINKLGLLDPLELWKNSKWNWDEWLNINVTMQTEINTYQFETLGKANFTEYAFISSNGVDLFQIDENGNCVINIDDKYFTVQKFLDDIEYIHKINNIRNNKLVNFEDRAKKLREGLNFNYYDKFSSPLINYINENKNWLELFIADEIIGVVCAPRGPDLDISISSRDYGSNNYWAIPTYCKNPEAVMEYMHWVFIDEENYNERRKYYTDFNYNGSNELFDYGIEWIKNSININPLHVVSYPIEIIFHDMYIMELDNTNNVHNLQELIDEYINIFV